MSAHIPVFRGQNFEFWKFKLATFLESKGLLCTLRPPTEETDKSWLKADAKARMYILESVDDEHVELIMQQNSARDMVRKLEGMYSVSVDADCTNGSKKNLRDDFLALKMADDDDPGHFFSTFETYVNALVDSGDRLSSKEILDCLLMSVCASYRPLVEAVDRQLEPSQALEVAKQKILVEYATRTNGANDGTKVEPPPQTADSWNAFKEEFKEQMEVRGRGQPGHWARQCSQPENAARANGADDVTKVEPPPQMGDSWNAFKEKFKQQMEVRGRGQPGHWAHQCPQPGYAPQTNGAMAVDGAKVESPLQKADSWNAFKEEFKEELKEEMEFLGRSQSGHLARQCPQSEYVASANGAMAVDGAKVESPSQKSDSWNAFKKVFEDELEECHRCGQSGHWTRECPQPMECYNCGQEGHMKFQCPQQELCHGCGQAGHLKFYCTQKPESCYGCGKEGHRKFECPNRLPPPDRLQPLPNHPAVPAKRSPASVATRLRSTPLAGRINGLQRGESSIQQLPAQQLPVHQLPAQQLPAHQLPAQQLPAHQLPALMDISVSPPAGVNVVEPTPSTEWILDACATEHSICDESLFSKCVPLEEPVSEEVNGHSLSALKMGEVRVCFRDGNRFHAKVLPKVYLIEEFKQNLLSIQRLVQFGGSVVLKASEVELRDPANQVMARGKKIDNFYVIESYSETLATEINFDPRA